MISYPSFPLMLMSSQTSAVLNHRCFLSCRKSSDASLMAGQQQNKPNANPVHYWWLTCTRGPVSFLFLLLDQYLCFMFYFKRGHLTVLGNKLTHWFEGYNRRSAVCVVEEARISWTHLMSCIFLAYWKCSVCITLHIELWLCYLPQTVIIQFNRCSCELAWKWHMDLIFCFLILSYF